MAAKKTTFDKTREVLGLSPDIEYGAAAQSIFNIVAKKFPATAIAHRAYVVDLISKGQFSMKQANAAVEYLTGAAKAGSLGSLSLSAFNETCGVGKTYTPQEIEEAVAAAIEANKGKSMYVVLGHVSNALPWADGAVLKKAVQSIFDPSTELPTDGDKQPREGKPKPQTATPVQSSTTEIRLLPLDQVFSCIPENNRYEQLPEFAEQHKAFLARLNVDVLTRFPPEPNGYLHLGHAKSLFINFGYAGAVRNGKTYLRMDDTNPEKEKKDYIDSIHEAVAWLGHKPFSETNASDYFDRLLDIAFALIRRGKAYICTQTVAEVGQYREDRRDPPGRARTTAENLRIFKEMTLGIHPEGSYTLRLRMDMQSDNPNMRDPIAYRIKYSAHPHSHDRFCVYPSYDYSHCLVDAFEHITHSICTLEFGSRRESYDWVTHAVAGIVCRDGWVCGYRPMQWEFSRLNVTYNVMSKRRLLVLVSDGHVRGWDDPRLLTIMGIRRRGFTPSIVNTFCQVCGVSRAPQTIDYGLLEHVARLEFDRESDRTMACIDPIRCELVDYKEGDLSAAKDVEEIRYPLHPKDPARGTVPLHFGRVFFIDASDFAETTTKDFFRLTPAQPAALRYGPTIYVKDVVKSIDASGRTVVSLRCTHNWDMAVKERHTAEMKAQKKQFAHIHWISEEDSKVAEVRVYDRLFKSPNPYEPVGGGEWITDVNPNSLVIHTDSRISSAVFEACKNSKKYKNFQFERTGYYAVDQDSTEAHPILNCTCSLKGTFVAPEIDVAAGN